MIFLEISLYTLKNLFYKIQFDTSIAKFTVNKHYVKKRAFLFESFGQIPYTCPIRIVVI